MSFGGDSASFEILVDVGALAAAGEEIGSAITKGVNTAKRGVHGLDDEVAKTAKAVGTAAERMGKSIGSNVAKGIKSNSAQVQAALISAATQNARGTQQAAAAAARSQLATQKAAAQQQTAIITAQGKSQAAVTQGIAQQQVIAARTAGAQRVAITRAVLDTIGRLEKGLARLVEGTASTIVSATRRAFAGTVGSIQRSFAERRSVITRNLNIENGLFATSAAVQQRTQRGVLGFGLGAAGLIGGGALAAGAIRQIFTLGSDFTRGLNVLQAQLQLTEFQMLGVDKLALQLGNDIKLPGVSALDAANAIGLLAKQFAAIGPFAISFAEDAAKGTLQLARATGATAEEAAQAVGAAVNVFKADAKGAVQIADQLAAGLSQAAGTSFSDFNLAFTQGAAVVSNFLVPAEGATNAITEFTAAIAILARGGVIGSDAGTSLKQFFLQANRGTDDANQAMAEISARAGVAGTAFFDESGKARTLFESISILRRGLEGLTDQQKQATIQTLFGADAARSATILIGQGEAAFLKTAAAVQRQGAASELAAAQNKGLAGALDAIKSQFETFGILIFKQVNKPLGNAGLAVANFVDKLANAGGVFAAVRAGLKGIGIALGSLLAIKGLVEVLGFVRSIAGALGPLGLAAVVLGGAIGFLLKRFGSFQGVLDAVGRLVERISPQVSKLRGTVFDFLSGLAQRAVFLGRFRGFLSQILDLLGQGKLSQAFDRVKVAAKALVENLAPIGRAFANLRKPIEAFIQGDFVRAFEGLKVVSGQIGRAVSDAIGLALKTVNPFAGVGIDFVKKFKGQFIGGGIGAVAGGLIAGPIGVALGAALGVAFTNALGRLRDIIGRVDVGALFGKFLNGVQEVGRRLGSFLSDQRFLLAVAGVAAAAAAIAARFVQGFVQGIVGHAGDIAAAVGKVFQAAFQLPSIVKSIVAFGILVRGLLTDQFKNLTFGDVLKKQIEQQLSRSVDTATFGEKLRAGFSLAGKKLGQALSVGIASALSGSALGSASSNLEKGLGIAGIAGSAAAAFASFGGGAQGAVAAAATAGVGLLTAALTANAKKAAEAKAAMSDYKTALDQAAESGKNVAEAINSIFGANVKRATDEQLQSIKALGINLNDFQDALAQGKGPEFLKTFTDRFRELQTLANRGAQAGGSFLSAQQSADLANLQSALPFLAKQINAVNDAGKRRDLEGSLRAGASAADRFEQRVTGVGSSADRLKTNIKDAAAAALALFKEQRAEALQKVLGTLAANAKAIGDRADESRRKLRELLHPEEKKTPQQAVDQQVIQIPTFGTEIQTAIESGLATAVGSASFNESLRSFGGSVGQTFEVALTSSDPAAALAQALQGQTVAINELGISDEAKAAMLKTLNDQFAVASTGKAIELGVQAREGDAAKAGIEAQAAAETAAAEKGEIPIRSGADLVQAQQAGAEIAKKANLTTDRLPASVTSKADPASAETAGKGVASRAASIVAKNPGNFGAKPDIAAASSAGKGVSSRAASIVAANPSSVKSKPDAVSAESAGKGVASRAASVVAQNPATIKVKGDISGAEGIGKNVVAGVARGISGSIFNINKAITAVVNGVTQTLQVRFGIQSPSKVTQEIGEQVMAGLEKGIREGGDAVATAVNDVAKAMIDRLKNVHNSLPNALKTLFDDTFEGLAVGGGGRTSKAVEGLTTSLRSVVRQVSSNAETLFTAAAKPANERTLAERLLLGESFISLRAGDEFGVANRGAISGAVDAIKSIGEALLEQGFSAQAAADNLLFYRSQLLLTAVQAGLSVREVDSLIDSLGLSVTGLQQFANQADRLNQIVAEGQRRAAVPNTPPPLTTGPNPTQQFITNNLYLPTGDPQANALAVVNRQALAVR